MAGKAVKSRISGAKVKIFRKQMPLSIVELAAETDKRAGAEGKRGISAKTIWRIENGANAQPYTIARLADALGVEPKDLMGEEEASGSQLSAYLCDFEDFIEDRTRDFVGREFVFDSIDEFINSNDCGYFFVKGDPGIGKSSIAAQLVKEREYIHHFNIKAEGINSADTFLKNICAQLIIYYELEYNSLPLDISTDTRFINKLLSEVSERLEPDVKMVIVVDALDEVNASSYLAGANLLYLPSSLPRGVFIIATTRRIPLSLRIESVKQEFHLDHDSPLNTEDIYKYLNDKINSARIKTYTKKQKVKPKVFIEKMARKSEGNFMYLRYVLPEIEKGIYKDLNLDQLPVGLDNYYDDHWERMGMRRKPLPRDKINIVYVLSVVQKPVSLSLILNFSKEGNPKLDEIAIQEVLDDWLQFLHLQKIDNQVKYSVYHTSFRDFLHRKDIVQAAGVTIEGIHNMIADNLWRELFPNEKSKEEKRRAIKKGISHPEKSSK